MDPQSESSNLNQAEISQGKSAIWVVLAIQLFWPLGIVLMWLWMKSWQKWGKILLTLYPVIFFLFALLIASLLLSLQNPTKQIKEAKQKYYQSLSPTPSPYLNPTVSQMQILDTSDWKIYSNDELKISFKYPPDWIVDYTNSSFTSSLCDMNKIDPTGSPNPLVKFGSCSGTGVTPSGSITMNVTLNIRPNSYQKDTSNQPIKLFYYSNPENLSIQNFNDKYLSETVAGDPVSIWSSSYRAVTNSSGINAYFDKEHYCVAVCQIYVWPHANKIFVLKNFPITVVSVNGIASQNDIFNQIFATLKFTN